MSDPLTLAAIAMSAMNTIDRSNAQAEQAEASASADEQRAQTAKRIATRNAADLSRRSRSLLASQRVRYGKGGIVLSGTPLDLLADAAAENQLAIQDALYEGDAVAIEGRRRADAARKSGKAARRQGLLAAGSQILRGI